MNLNQVTLPVVDMLAATSFYKKMGFLQIVDTPHYARFEATEGGATFSLILEPEQKNTGFSDTPMDRSLSSAVIYFEHEALDELVDMLKNKGLEFAQEPTDMSYLWREAILYDPSGNKIKLYWAGDNRLNPPWRVKLSD